MNKYYIFIATQPAMSTELDMAERRSIIFRGRKIGVFYHDNRLRVLIVDE